MEKKSAMSDNSSGTLSVGFGILSVLFSLLTPFHGVLFAFVSLGFAMAQKKNSKNSWSKAGFILSIVGLALNILTWILVAYFYKNLGLSV